MNITKNALRSFFSKKTQAILAVLLIIFGVFFYTAFANINYVTDGAITSYDASQNTEDYGFIPRLKLTDEQWEVIFADYNIPESAQAGTDVIIQQYQVNLYDYQEDFISQVESKYDMTVETSFNKMLSDEATGHQYRVFSDTGSINKPYIVEGSLPTTANELTILPEYAKYNNLKVGDTLEINGSEYTISGFVYCPAYVTPIVTTNVVKESSVYYADTQSIIFMTEDALNQLAGQASYSYKGKANQDLTSAEKNALYNRLYDSNDFEVLDNALDSITHGETYRKVNVINILIIALSLVLCGACLFVVTQVIKRRIEADKRQIGTLKALGYKSLEVARSYCSFAVIISVLGSTIGCILGFLAYKPLIDILYKDYNMPMNISADYMTLAYAFIVPLVFLVSISLITALIMLKKPPLDLIRDNSDSKVNSLGRWVTRVLRKASFEVRAKYQIACRSVSKIVAMFSIGVVASILLLIGLVMSTALGGMVDKTFTGFNVESTVTFNMNSNINDKQPQYEDEEICLGKDLFIQEVRYQNGQTLTLDDANRKIAEVIGMNPDSAYISLINEKGETINNVLTEGVVINKVIEGKYGLQIGDRLLLNSTHENIEFEIEIVAIADQYSGYIMYTDFGELNNLFGYEEGSYNAIFTNHQYQLEDSNVQKILEVTAFQDGLGSNLRNFELLFQIIMALAIVIAFVLIIISANLVIEENSKNISTFKVLGYSGREISNLVVNTYTPTIIIGFLLALPVSSYVMEILKNILETQFELPMTVSLSVINILLGFAILMITYFVGLLCSKRNIDKVALAESLKLEL